MTKKKMKKAPIVFGTALGLAVVSGTLFTFANNGASISLEQAKAIALQDAQLTAEQVTFVKERKESDDGRAVYDIEFYSGTQEFDYEIDARSGAITEKDFDIDDFNAASLQNSSNSQTATTPTQKTFISEEEAKRIAVLDAGVNAEEVTFLTVKLDTDDNRDEYDIEFYVGGTEYDYEIDAVTGAINERDWDVEHYVASTSQSQATQAPAVQAPAAQAPVTQAPASQTPQAAAPRGNFIGEAEAKRIALSDAGLSASQVTFLKVKLDTDDGRNEYDIEFYVGGTEYDYEIDAATGAINERDWDVENYSASAPASGYYYDYDDDDDDRYDDDRYDDDDDDRR